ncbi:MAG: carboxymuconolactone decarboxylase family protein [ANME-2 cluster archaeon]|nr:carboxymuconolactone decarboxylase family protein [ANME-2 cluster archaeon]
MELEDIKRILEKDPDEAAEELLEGVEQYYGEIPYILQFMKDQPDLLVSKILYDNSILREFKRLDRKTIELISIAVSSAIQCTHCLNIHLRVAKRMGIPKEEIFDAILIAGVLSNASVLAYSTRAMDAELSDKGPVVHECDNESCDVCTIPGNTDEY